MTAALQVSALENMNTTTLAVQNNVKTYRKQAADSHNCGGKMMMMMMMMDELLSSKVTLK